MAGVLERAGRRSVKELKELCERLGGDASEAGLGVQCYVSDVDRALEELDTILTYAWFDLDGFTVRDFTVTDGREEVAVSRWEPVYWERGSPLLVKFKVNVGSISGEHLDEVEGILSSLKKKVESLGARFIRAGILGYPSKGEERLLSLSIGAEVEMSSLKEKERIADKLRKLASIIEEKSREILKLRQL